MDIDNDNEESDFEMSTNTPKELRTDNLLPETSKELYKAMYDQFKNWRTEKQAAISENLLLAYFTELSKQYKPSTLWSKYSFLKATIKLNDNIDIGTYTKLTSFLKRHAEGYTPKKSNVLTDENIKTFLETAPDEVYLATKVSIIFSIMGTLRIDELLRIELQHVEDHEKLYLVRIPNKTNTKTVKTFTIHDEYYNTVKRYLSLRPSKVPHKRALINYQKQKCTAQPIGKNKFSGMAKEVAKFLNLPDPNSYTGYSFRRSKAPTDVPTIKRHGSWKSLKIVEGYVQHSLASKIKISSLAGNSRDSKSKNKNAESNSSNRFNDPTKADEQEIEIPVPHNLNFNNCNVTIHMIANKQI